MMLGDVYETGILSIQTPLDQVLEHQIKLTMDRLSHGGYHDSSGGTIGGSIYSFKMAPWKQKNRQKLEWQNNRDYLMVEGL